MPTISRTPPPDWASLPDPIPSVEVAALFGVKPGSLSQYVKRGQLARAIRTEANMAWYAKSDVRDFWDVRERRKATFYAGPPTHLTKPADSTPERGDTVVAPAAQSASPALLEAITGAIADGVRQGQADAITPLLEELRALREEVAALRSEAVQARQSPATPPTKSFWERLLGR